MATSEEELCLPFLRGLWRDFEQLVQDDSAVVIWSWLIIFPVFSFITCRNYMDLFVSGVYLHLCVLPHYAQNLHTGTDGRAGQKDTQKL